MIEFLSSIFSSPHWVFVILGGVLLIVELLGTGGYSLWSGISAIIVGAIAWLLPLPWSEVWILFAVITLCTAYFWWVWLKKHAKDKSKGSYLNQPKHELIGIKTTVVEPIVNGAGRVKIKDGTWSATCREDLTVGTRVLVTDVDSLVLTVEKIIE